MEIEWVFGLTNTQTHNTHLTTPQYLGLKTKPTKPRPASASASSTSVAAGTPAAAPMHEVEREAVCKLLAKHGASCVYTSCVIFVYRI